MDAARLNSVGFEADAMLTTTYATAKSGTEFEIYCIPNSGWVVDGHGIVGNFPSLVAFLTAN